MWGTVWVTALAALRLAEVGLSLISIFAEWRPYPPCWDSENASVFKLLYTYNGFVEAKSEQKPSFIAEAFFPHPSVRSILHGRRELEGQANRFYLGVGPLAGGSLPRVVRNKLELHRLSVRLGVKRRTPPRWTPRGNREYKMPLICLTSQGAFT